MTGRLDSYRRKRDPARTPEPPAAERAAADSAQPRFVVQEHSATRLHWDLRLEHDGVLASWAVPRGIPRDPAENRKAIRTEDHPLEYLDFEGDIPKGQYGAGRMRIWDRGTYELEKWQDRKVMVNFHGERVRGRYALFATGRKGDEDGRDWMIHRIDPPEEPEREPLPERLVPMLATLGELPDGEGWAYEIKWDGVRALVYSEPGRVKLVSRNLNDITSQYPEIGAIGRALGAREALLDGEIVAFDSQGRPSFELLQQRMHLASERQVRERRRSTPVVYIAFDLLHLDGEALLDLPYRERRDRLAALDLEGGSAWQVPGYHQGDAAALLAASRERGLEGVVAKRLDSPYRPGRRSRAWIKVKNLRSELFAIAGWMPGEGRRRERIGALLVGRRAEDGGLEYAGRVGTGFTERELEDLHARLSELRTEHNPFRRGRGPRGAVWVEPELSCEVEFREWTRDGVLRAPSYRGLREVDRAGAGSGPTREVEGIGPVRRLPRGDFEVEVEGRRLKLTNFDKVLYPETGFTKGALVEYYARIAPAVLPHLHGRPLTLKRYPNGVQADYFYEKQAPGHRPEWVETARIRLERDERAIDFCLANDLPTLVWLANLADLELHPSLSLATDPDRPTTLAFDLDPGAPAGLVECCAVALWLRDVLGSVGLRGYPKTSGSKGLQVYVPLNARATYDQTKPLAKAIAELLEKEHRDSVVSRMSKDLRRGKVLVDWSQNDRHKTTVCVYSLRARDRPTVSTPVDWDEVAATAESGDPAALTFEWDEVLRRVEDRGDLFAPVLSLTQELPAL